MPVDADTPDVLRALPRRVRNGGRTVLGQREDVEPQSIHEQGHISSPLDARSPPVVLGLETLVYRRHVCRRALHPAVDPVAAPVPFRRVSFAPEPAPGGVHIPHRRAQTVLIDDGLHSRRAAANLVVVLV